MGTQEEVISGGARRFLRSKCSREPLSDIHNLKSRGQHPVSMSANPAKTRSCKFFGMPSGCVRGENCSFAHAPGDFRREKRTPLAKIKKILVSGLPPFVDSEDLYSFFERKFGSLVDAIVVPHADEQTAGRFGILTFRNEESLFAAIQASSVYIFGQKIKLELIYGRAAATSEMQDFPCKKLFGGDDDHSAKTPPPIKSLVKCPSLPPWAQKFRDWLPDFLVEVSKRLADGEAYPLCSLKGDFRATCGLEIDHIALGFEKLSDFIRAWPEICKPRVVPVGSGPATHIVLENALKSPELYPSVSNPFPSAAAANDYYYLFNNNSNFKNETRRFLAEKSSDGGSRAGLPSADEVHSMFGSESRRLPTMEKGIHSMNLGDGYDTSALSSVCMSCLREEALWVAFPCGHRALCSSCKEEAENNESCPCFVCQGCIEGWAAMP